MALESGIFDQVVEDIPAEILDMKPDEIRRRVRLLDSEIRVTSIVSIPLSKHPASRQVLNEESRRLDLDKNQMKEKIRENQEKVPFQ